MYVTSEVICATEMASASQDDAARTDRREASRLSTPPTAWCNAEALRRARYYSASITNTDSVEMKIVLSNDIKVKQLGAGIGYWVYILASRCIYHSKSTVHVHNSRFMFDSTVRAFPRGPMIT